MKTFRAYADEWRGVRHAYVQVRVFGTRAEMCQDIDDCDFGPSLNAHGQCSGLMHYNRAGRLTGRFACMWLNREDLRANGAEIVAHECVHAGMRHMANRGLNVQQPGNGWSVHDNEEALAYTVGHLAKLINDRLHRLGVFA
ncbi:hypothetical protein [Acidovorax kalamii]|uniref:hypothetical protein n=1 Tax=Acidovorax kalamii TaxID=2004485 RepID=UPI002090593E|nr:hypothetical protein [Acidovorax kalamii]MCO5355064.1 hypothetical protein [Acidovorax kalamii]